MVLLGFEPRVQNGRIQVDEIENHVEVVNAK